MKARDDEETKLFRDRHGLPVAHSQVDAVIHPPCMKPLEMRGTKACHPDGRDYVEWYGDALHHELFCPDHGSVTSVDTDFNEALRASREREKDKDGGW